LECPLFFFFLEKPNLFVICNNAFSKIEDAVKYFTDLIQWAGWTASPETTCTTSSYDYPIFIKQKLAEKKVHMSVNPDRLCGLVVRVLGYRSGGPGSIPGTTRFSEKKKEKRKKKTVVGLERGPLSLVSTTEELLNRKVAVPV
jgi:hypothetical protein